MMASIDLTFESSGDCIVDPCGAYDVIVELRQRLEASETDRDRLINELRNAKEKRTQVVDPNAIWIGMEFAVSENTA